MVIFISALLITSIIINFLQYLKSVYHLDEVNKLLNSIELIINEYVEE